MSDEQQIRAEVEERVRGEEAERAAEAAEKAAKKAKPPTVTSQEIIDALYDNQVGDARLLVKLGQGRFCYDNGAATWYAWNCSCWHPDGVRNAEVLLEEVARLYEREAAKQAKAAKDLKGEEEAAVKDLAKSLRKRAFTLRGDDRIRSVMRRATAGTGSLGIAGDEWDGEPTLLPCANGVIDLATGKLLPGDPGQFLRRSSPVEYKGYNETAPTWDDVRAKALRRMPELIDYFDRVVGYCATGLATFKDFFCAYGPGGDNGKSVVFETLQRVLGTFAGTVGVSLLLDEGFVRSSAGPSPDLLKLRGLRMAVTSEAEQQHKFSMAKIKMLVSGGDTITAREPYAKRDVEFAPTHTLILHTNFMPRAKGNDRAFFRRLRVIAFRARFLGPDEASLVNEDEHIYLATPREILDRKLAEEAPGILAYVVRCTMRFLKELDLTPPRCVIEETREYQDDQDLVGRFLDECCEVGDQFSTQMGTIHEAFKLYCTDREGYEEKGKQKPPSLIWLSREFKARAEIKKLQDRPVAIYNLRVKEDWLPVDSETGRQAATGADMGGDDVPF